MMRPATSKRNHHRGDRWPATGCRPNHRQEWVPRGSAPAVAAAPILPTPPPSADEHGHRHRHRQPQSSRPPPPSSSVGETENNNSMPQLVQEIQDKLVKGAVECMICYDMVRRSAAIWSCSSCYSIFHLHCIRKWARSPTSANSSSSFDGGGDVAAAGWRCPGCQSVQSVSYRELSYTCFCGSRRDPTNDLYLTPHSCGEPCRKPLNRSPVAPNTFSSDGNGGGDSAGCPHVCVLQCHPGPCPPCKALAPRRTCPCGKKTIVRRCSDQKSTLTCGQQCDRLLSCGRHRCRRICHADSCNPCRVLIAASCFCKKTTEVVLCGDMLAKGNAVAFADGVFACNKVCGRALSCGNHFCGQNCHPGLCRECELIPDKIKHCHCGKARLEKERMSCLDSIPTCSETCEKILPCGTHRCRVSCHEGDCPPCLVQVDQKCRCWSSSQMTECYRASGEDGGVFICDKPCGKKKNCGRHRCSEHCCPLSGPASGILFDNWDPHLCSMPCGKKLRCGQHSCQLLCHSGYCPPCPETIFIDLTCACGKTSIPPPLPCGTPIPSCPHPCLVAQPCGHSASHTCHFGDCPPCSVPVAKECIGRHVLLRNIPCGSKDIRCNQLCGKTRQCGIHACGRTCHPPPCDASCASGSYPGTRSSCGQICGSPRRDCKHTCSAPCHPLEPCPDIRCDVPVTITCSCGRISAAVPCSAGGSISGFHVDSVLEASFLQKLPVPLLPVEANGKKTPLGQRKLTCDEECAKMERKRVLADAFDIAPPNLDALRFGENSAASDSLADIFRREPKWVLAVEERMKFLVLGKTRGGASAGPRVHVFSNMLKEKRDAIRQIVERWKLAVQIAGWEPKRFLVVHATPKSRPPARTLGSKPWGPGVTAPQPPVFDPLVDMDPRLVVAMLDLPRDADISALVLRFGGECELVWLNDKNALAVFADPARAATALRRLDHGSVYQGAVVVVSGPPANNANAWRVGPKDGGVAPKGGNTPWRKILAPESDSNSWGGSWPSSAGDVAPPIWRPIEGAPISESPNPWNALNYDTAMASVSAEPTADSSNVVVSSGEGGLKMKLEVVDDWEEACD